MMYEEPIKKAAAGGNNNSQTEMAAALTFTRSTRSLNFLAYLYDSNCSKPPKIELETEPNTLSRSNKKKRIRPNLASAIARHIKFSHVHIWYFAILTCLGALMLWLLPKPEVKNLTFIDALFTAVSALSLTGLSGVNVQDWSTGDTVCILLLTILGSHVMTSLFPIYMNEWHFKQCQKETAIGMQDDKLTSLHEMEEDVRLTNNPTKLRLLERDALVVLKRVVLVYSAVILLMGFFFIEIYLLCSPSYLEALRKRNINHVFFAFCTSVGAFTNSGFVILNDNMIPFCRSAPVLLCVALQVLAGNTLFSPTLRVIIWILHRMSLRNYVRKKLLYEYLLTHPRECYTHLFPYRHTIWLVVTVMFLTVLQTIFLFLLDWNTKTFEGLTTKDRLLDGFFQSVSTRHVGENVVDMSVVSDAMLVLYIGMMYIAVYPIYLSRQSSRSRIQESELALPNPHKNYLKKYSWDEADSRISVQCRRLFARDSVYLFLSIFVLCILERWNISYDPLNYSVFNIFFELISAYSNVGFSVGYKCELTPGHNTSGCQGVSYSFSGKWSTSGKVVLMIVMILGRHRGLPDEADQATRISSIRAWLANVINYEHDDTVSKIPGTSEPDAGNKSSDECTIHMSSSISKERSIYSLETASTKLKHNTVKSSQQHEKDPEDIQNYLQIQPGSNVQDSTQPHSRGEEKEVEPIIVAYKPSAINQISTSTKTVGVIGIEE